ncbi:Cof-type HAD-IIB family hydrolase [Psychrobacter piechaudii]|uniref:Putative bifunctional phosphatase/peptidyl-prolyl cis-trans isomerase n=1 Tax=Psychrobacter piechaudii TaxID=1945521 RepID=A0A1R4GR26_9GAMM|nr:Cof-type HAD-IIB family hydrolase [Psychrobacter piechaudii]SJM70649.1 Putative bifunctional phosphatase/peptidyl-prolyl cis-trans isomerase [Psychrobacter piechaudii]
MTQTLATAVNLSPVPFTPKIIFFDIDDTLSRGGVIAPHNKTTLERLSNTDIKLVIATGRSKAIIPEDILGLFEAGVFDAIVCTNGQYSFDKEGIISHYPLTLQQAAKIDELCRQDHLIHKFDSDTHLAWANDNEQIRAFIASNPSSIIDPNYYKSNPVYQCSVFFKDDERRMQEVDFAKFGLKLVHWHQIGGDILPIDASKERGVRDVCQHFDIDISEAMAIGDGFNDLEMFDAVGYAIAMGDGQPALQQRADFITGSIEEYGLQQVLHPLLEIENS